MLSEYQCLENVTNRDLLFSIIKTWKVRVQLDLQEGIENLNGNLKGVSSYVTLRIFYRSFMVFEAIVVLQVADYVSRLLTRQLTLGFSLLWYLKLVFITHCNS